MTYVESSLDDTILAEDLSGERFLHIGCASGDLCLKALERGAAAATGIDISADQIRGARKAAAPAQKVPELIRADFEHWDPRPQSFEVVACGNLLHHFYEPIGAVRKIMQLTRKRFYLHLASQPGLFPSKTAALPGVWRLRKTPRISLGRRQVALRAADCTFAFERRALEVIINCHSKAYEPVQFHRLPEKAGWIIEARRRQIGHLVVVAGATAAGKSRFIRQLGEAPIRKRFGIEDHRFQVIKPEQVDSLGRGFHGTVVYHYDLLRPFDRPLQTHERDPAFHLLSSAERITVITLAERAEVLRKRMLQRRRRRQASGERLIERATRKLERIGDPAFLAEWYQRWSRAVDMYVQSAGNRTFFLGSDEHWTDLQDVGGVLRLFGAGSGELASPGARTDGNLETLQSYR